MISGVLNPEKIWHENLIDLFTSLVRCSHFTLGNPKKSFSAVLFMHTLNYLGYFRRKQIVVHLPTLPENVTTLTCEMQNFFIWLKVFCVLSMLEAVKRASCHRWLCKEPVVLCGNWNARQAMSQQVFRVTTFCISTRFQSFSSLVSRIVHHAVLKFSPYRNKPLL